MENRIVKYQSKDGQEISLTFETVKKYLVSGKRELITEQELMYFMGVCKSKGLNPFKRDVYLVKYNQDPAAIVTSIDYFRSRAKAQSDCRGWQKGIIVKNKEGLIKDTCGLLLDGEELVGGFFEATPKGWDKPFRLEVNLNGYIKKTRDGSTTQFWQDDKQPTMIAKVAESQGLRTIWPDEFQGIHEEGEIPKGETINADFHTISNGKINGKAFDKQVPPSTNQEQLNEYLVQVAEGNDCTVEEIMAEAVKDFDKFWKTFEAWGKKQKAKKTKQPDKKSTAKKSEAEEEEKHFNPLNSKKDFESLDDMDQLKVINELAELVNYDKEKLPKTLGDTTEKEMIELYMVLRAKRESQG